MTSIKLDIFIDANTRRRPHLILEDHEQQMAWVGNGWRFQSDYFVVGPDRDVDVIAFCQGISGTATTMKIAINDDEVVSKSKTFKNGAIAFIETVLLPSTSN